MCARAYRLPLFPLALLFVALSLLPFFLACQEAQDADEIQPPPVDGKPPFAVGAPELTQANHRGVWGRGDCATCHVVSLIKNHSSFNANQCIKCHGYNGTASPTCGDCHNVPNPQGFPNTGLHEFHAGQKAYDCQECHAKNIHRNGGLDIALKRQGQFLPVNGGTPGCTESGCHEARNWTPTACESCHTSPLDNPMHRKHLGVNEKDGKPALTCRDCHRNNQHDADTTSGLIEVGGLGWSEWDVFTGKCQTACHDGKERTWDCAACHGYPPTTGRHKTHAADYKVECRVCHASHQHDFVAAMTPKDYRKNIRISFLFLRGNWNKATATCSDVGCHEDRTWQ